MRGNKGDRRRLYVLVLGAAIVFAIAFVGLTSGFGGPSLPDRDIAYVEDVSTGGDITQEEFDAALEQAAARQGVEEVPEPGDPQYDVLKEAALSDLILARWVEGEAEERGIEVSDPAVDDELERIIDEQFGNQRQFERFLEQQSFTEDDARARVRLQLLSTRIQEQVFDEDVEVTDEEIDEYYETNISAFQTPANRDVRLILNPNENKAQQAFDRLSEDDSPDSWNKVAKRFSTDEGTKELGGLRQAVIAGQNEPALDQAIFTSPENELVGPIKTDSGFYVLQVTKITEASTQELDDQTREQISQTLQAQRQQDLAGRFQTDFATRWQARTICAEDYVIDRCSNAKPAGDACVGDDDGEDPPPSPDGEERDGIGCPAFVPSIRPVEPGTAGRPGAVGRPQGPVHGNAPPVLPEGLPIGDPTQAPPGG